MEEQRRMQTVDTHVAPTVPAARMLHHQESAALALLNIVYVQTDHGTI